MHTYKYKIGQRLNYDGRREGCTVVAHYHGMYEVRVWDGTRVVGLACVSEHDLELYQRQESR